jgi:hypothetical protein
LEWRGRFGNEEGDGRLSYDIMIKLLTPISEFGGYGKVILQFGVVML